MVNIRGDLVAVMVTVDRSPLKNYLDKTLTNLLESDLLSSERLDSLLIFDSDGNSEYALQTVKDLGLPRGARERIFAYRTPGKRLVANANVGTALAYGAAMNPSWVIFLEDDIDVCGDFFESVGKWLDDHAREDRIVYAFGAAYPQPTLFSKRGIWYWDYPISGFYGTQCFAVRPGDARSLAKRLLDNPFEMNDIGAAYDIAMHRWAKGAWPDIHHFAASCPSFVQHIGMNSSIAPRNRIHTFPSFPGKKWSYLEVRG